MKKWILILTAFLLVFTVSSCKKQTDLGKLNYYIVGAYIEMEKDDNYQLGDVNPCIYYQYATDTLKLNRGLYSVEYDNITKQVFTNEEGVNCCIINLTASFYPEYDDEIKVYRVYENLNGTSYVDQSEYKVIHLDKGGDYKLNYKYKINEQTYQLEFKIRYSKRSA